MPLDITMCYGDGCPLRQRCYRYRGVPEGRQTWFGALPFDRARGTCEQLWDVARLEPTQDSIRTRAYYLWVAAGRPEGTADANWEAARATLMEATRRLLRDDLP